MEWMILPLKRYFEVRGRSRRMEYWMFVLFSFLIGIATTIVDNVLGFGWEGTGPLNGLTSLALLIPSFTVAFRRLHDTNRSAWWMLLVFLPIIGWIWAILSLIMNSDEFMRALLAKRFVVSAGLAMAIASFWGFGESYANAPHLPNWLIFPLFWACMALMTPLIRTSR